MRRSFAAAFLLLAVTAAPIAAASPSSIEIGLPSGELPGDAVVPVEINLTIHDFMCHYARDFVVELDLTTTEGVVAEFASDNVTFTTPAHAYFVETYQETHTVDLRLRSAVDGQIEITATLAPAAAGPCFAPGGFEQSSAGAAASVKGADLSSPEPTPPPANETPTTPVANETPSADNETTAPPKASPWSNGACAPQTSCGLIGEYDAPQESVSNDTPGLGLVGVGAAVVLGAFVLRRRKA